jgi:phosphoribosyl 1,2-cyclic phosphodiesterase
MSLFISSLNSGSNGNCYYIGNDNEAVLVDAGISCRETEKRMRKIGLSMDKVKAIFVSHEHSDHIKGIPTLSEKYKLPVYITSDTLRHGGRDINKQYTKEFKANEPVIIGNLSVIAFSKHHDAADPHSFIVNGNGVTIGVFTDIGRSCQNLASHFSQCHAAFLESNYDEELLENGRYPIHLKRRIRSGSGHLSNIEALEVFNSYRPPFMSHLLLSHLSEQNNCPDLVKALFQRHAGNTNIVIASRYEQTPLYKIEGKIDSTVLQVRKTVLKKPEQMSLFN